MPITPEHLARLCPPLAALLQAELDAGNRVVETSTQWPTPLSIWLARPFLCPPAKLPEGVTYRDVNDPHYWKAEYVHEPTRHMLACRFG